MVGRKGLITACVLSTILLGWTWPEAPQGWTLDVAGYGGWADPSKYSNIYNSGANGAMRHGDMNLAGSVAIGARLEACPDQSWWCVGLDYLYSQPDIRAQRHVWTFNTLTGQMSEGSIKGWPMKIHTVSPMLFARPFSLGDLMPYVGIGPAVSFSTQCDHLGCTANTAVGLRFVGGVSYPVSPRCRLFGEAGLLSTRLTFNDSQGAYAGQLDQVQSVGGLSCRLWGGEQ